MTFIRTIALFATATALSSPLAAKPAAGPNRYFTGGDLFNLEVATDPQISPDGRTIAYVRKSNDIMTDRARATIWLVDVATGQQRPLLAGAGSYSSPRWSPDGTRLACIGSEAGSTQLVRWIAGGEARGSPASPTAPTASPGRPTVTTSVIRCSSPTTGQARLGASFRRREVGRPLQIIDTVTYRADSAGYLKPVTTKIFWVPSDGGADPIDLRRDPRRRRRSLPGRPICRDPVQRQSVEELGARAGRQRSLPGQH